MEATEVVEPQPFDLNESKSYSNLFNCDKAGLLLYLAAALKQIQDIAQRSGLPENEALPNVKTDTIHVQPEKPETAENFANTKKRNFWNRLFGKD